MPTTIDALSTPLSLPEERARALMRQQAAWTSAFALTAAGLAAAGLGGTAAGLGVALGTAVIAARPRWVWSPLIVGGIAAAAWAGGAASISPALTAGAAAGWLTARLEGDRDGLDQLNGLLAGGATAGLGLWAALRLFPGSDLLSTIGAAAVTGLISAQTLIPLALVWRSGEQLPSERTIRITLAERYREAPLRALALFKQLRGMAPAADTLAGLREVTSWVYRLSDSLQTLDRELEQFHPLEVRTRIADLYEQAKGADDGFTRERRLATATHLEKLLEHAERLDLERERMASLQEYSLAYLEEARMGLVLARELPGEDTPGRLDEVLERLREHAKEGELRRQTAREVRRMEA